MPRHHYRIDLSAVRAIEAERDAARDERDRVLQQLRASRSLANRADEKTRLIAQKVSDLQEDKEKFESALRKVFVDTKWCYVCNAKKHKASCPLRS